MICSTLFFALYCVFFSVKHFTPAWPPHAKKWKMTCWDKWPYCLDWMQEKTFHMQTVQAPVPKNLVNTCTCLHSYRIIETMELGAFYGWMMAMGGLWFEQRILDIEYLQCSYSVFVKFLLVSHRNFWHAANPGHSATQWNMQDCADCFSLPTFFSRHSPKTISPWECIIMKITLNVPMAGQQRSEHIFQNTTSICVWVLLNILFDFVLNHAQQTSTNLAWFVLIFLINFAHVNPYKSL